MIKKIWVLLIALVLFVNVTSFADNEHIVDDIGLLSSSEKADLETRIDNFINEHQFDLVVWFTEEYTNNIDYQSSDFYDANYGFGEDKIGIIFEVNMNTREYCINIAGEDLIYKIPDAAQDDILDWTFDNLADGYYYEMVIDLLDSLDYVLNHQDNYRHEIIYVPSPKPTEPNPFESAKMRLLMMGVGSLTLSLLVAAISVTMMIKKLKGTAKKTSANDYIRKGSLNLSRSHEIFLYTTTTRVRISSPSNNRGGHSGGSSTYHSYSGISHSSSSRHF